MMEASNSQKSTTGSNKKIEMGNSSSNNSILQIEDAITTPKRILQSSSKYLCNIISKYSNKSKYFLDKKKEN